MFEILHLKQFDKNIHIYDSRTHVTYDVLQNDIY